MNQVVLKISGALVIVLLLFTVIRSCSDPGYARYGPGVQAPNQPLQVNIDSPASFEMDGYTLTPLAEFESEARVLSTRDYRSGREAELSPVDFALGWGPMSDEEVIKQIKISQMNRFYMWRTDEFPIPRREIETHSANMHMVPASRTIAQKLRLVQKGDVIQLKGKLILAEAPDGWRWMSSLTREDTGDGACELVYVEELTFVMP